MNFKTTTLTFILSIALCNTALAKDKKKEALEKGLATKKISIDFSQTPLADVLAFFGDITGMNFVLDKGAKLDAEEVSLKLKKVSLINALKLSLAVNPDAAYKIEHGMIIVSTKKRLKSFKPEKAPTKSTADQKKKWAALKKKVMSANFSDTPLTDVLSFLNDISGEKLKLQSAKLGKLKVSLRAKKVSLIDILSYIAQCNNLKLAWDGNNLILRIRN